MASIHIVAVYRETPQAEERAISSLLKDAGPTPHWTASAYLFTTLIEQQILRHYAAPSLDGYIEAAIGVSDIDRLQSIEPEAQLEYLDAVVEAADD